VPTRSIPALTQSVVDTVGAGDAFLSVTAPLVAAGGNLAEVGFVGNLAGAIKVGIVGHRASVDKPSVVKAITAMLK
jgi:sugar/nucleoside kinase (ribokinase family)